MDVFDMFPQAPSKETFFDGGKRAGSRSRTGGRRGTSSTEAPKAEEGRRRVVAGVALGAPSFLHPAYM